MRIRFKSVWLVFFVAVGLFFLVACSKKKEKPAPIVVPYNSSFSSTPSQPLPSEITAIGTPNRPQSVDIISGKPINRSFYTDINGSRLYFCCDESRRIFQGSSSQYLAAIQKAGIILDVVE